MDYKYKKIIYGGTFDIHRYPDKSYGVHAGHKDFLSLASELAPEHYIGLRTNRSLRHSKKGLVELIRAYRRRKKNLKTELKGLGVEKYKIVRLRGIYRGNVVRKKFNYGDVAILVTEETLKGAETINEERQKRGLNPLPVEIATLRLAEDKKTKISSSLIRFEKMWPDGRLKPSY